MHQWAKQKISRPISHRPIQTEKTNEWDKAFQGLTFRLTSVNNRRNIPSGVENYSCKGLIMA